MNELISEFSTLKYWIAVILASFIVNLVASYAKKRLDKSLSKINRAYRSRLEKQERQEQELFALLCKSAELRNIHRQDSIFERVRSVWFITCSVGLVILGFLIKLTAPESVVFVADVFTFIALIGALLSMKFSTSSARKWERAVSATDANN